MALPTRRFALRERTSQLHAAVDAAVGSFETTAGYARYLSGIHRFRADVEKGLETVDWPQTFGAWRPQAVAALAKADLDDLGLRGRSGLSPVFDLADPSHLIGALYVLEGSSLGARVLYTRAQALGLSDSHGARHLALQANGLDNWRGFLTLLDAMDGFDLEGAVDGAEHVFRHAARAFESDTRHAA